MTELTNIIWSVHDVGVSDLADRVRELRQKRGLSMNDLDDLTGSKGYTSRIEGRKRLGLRTGTLELFAAALGTNPDHLARGVGPVDAVPAAPSNWDLSRRGVAMRVLLGLGIPAGDIEAAAERHRIRSGDLQTEVTPSIVHSIRAELEHPSTAEELEAAKRRARDFEDRDTLAMARRAALALEAEFNVEPARAWSIMREIRLHNPSTDSLIGEGVRLLGLGKASEPTDDPVARRQLARKPGTKGKKA